jgi:hypothetical protein
MIDIETLGTKPGAPVTSIGACWFDPEQTNWMNGTARPAYPGYWRINVEEVINLCRDGITGSTLLWWMEQSEQARKELTNKAGTVTVRQALQGLRQMIMNQSEVVYHRDVYVWGNSNLFDMGLLEHLYQKLNIDIPWHYSRDMNVRTITWLAKMLHGVERPEMPEGMAHNAFNDAQHQARYVQSMVALIRSGGKSDADPDA